MVIKQYILNIDYDYADSWNSLPFLILKPILLKRYRFLDVRYASGGIEAIIKIKKAF